MLADTDDATRQHQTLPWLALWQTIIDTCHWPLPDCQGTKMVKMKNERGELHTLQHIHCMLSSRAPKTPDAQRSAAVLFLRHAARRRQRGLAAQVHIRLTTNKNLWRRTQQMAWNPVSSAFSRWCSHVRFVCFRCVSLWMRRGCWGVWRSRGWGYDLIRRSLSLAQTFGPCICLFVSLCIFWSCWRQSIHSYYKEKSSKDSDNLIVGYIWPSPVIVTVRH